MSVLNDLDLCVNGRKLVVEYLWVLCYCVFFCVMENCFFDCCFFCCCCVFYIVFFWVGGVWFVII